MQIIPVQWSDVAIATQSTIKTSRTGENSEKCRLNEHGSQEIVLYGPTNDNTFTIGDGSKSLLSRSSFKNGPKHPIATLLH